VLVVLLGAWAGALLWLRKTRRRRALRGVSPAVEAVGKGARVGPKSSVVAVAERDAAAAAKADVGSVDAEAGRAPAV
jgi:hypothetical protein